MAEISRGRQLIGAALTVAGSFLMGFGVCGLWMAPSGPTQAQFDTMNAQFQECHAVWQETQRLSDGRQVLLNQALAGLRQANATGARLRAIVDESFANHDACRRQRSEALALARRAADRCGL